jgi:hypothetical protein
MSAVPALAARRAAVATQTPPALRVVPPPKRRRGYVAYLTTLLVLLVGGSTCVLCLRTELARGAFEIQDLKSQLAGAEATHFELQEQLTLRSAPDWLAAKASELGMVRAEGIAYNLLEEGRIVGSAPVAVDPAVAAAEAAAAAGEATDQAVAATSGGDTVQTAPDAAAGTTGEGQ